MSLPNRIFFTGVPGSRWSGIAQTIEQVPGFNVSDRLLSRAYVDNGFTGHQGAYFGRMMEHLLLTVFKESMSALRKQWIPVLEKLGSSN